MYSEKLTPIETNTIFTWDVKYAKVVNRFFSNLVKNLKIP